MGFHAKILFVTAEYVKVDKAGSNGEIKCIVWKDAETGIDWGHITRLEKVIGSRYKDVHHTPFRRAGICVVACFLDKLWIELEGNVQSRFAPEILIPMKIFEDDPAPTIKIGGRTYLDCRMDRLKGSVGNTNFIPRHNSAVRDSTSILAHLNSGRWTIIDPPLFWVPCRDMANWLFEAEGNNTEVWRAIKDDTISLAFVLGWRHLLRELGDVGARAVFRFS